MIETLVSISQSIFGLSCKAGLVICAILLFHLLLGKRLSPATRYLLWLLVPMPSFVQLLIQHFIFLSMISCITFLH